MKCPYCRGDATDVFNSRSTKSGNQIWRRRRCLACNESFTTYEAPDLSFIDVVKQSGNRQRYARSILFGSMCEAFSGLKAKPDDIDAVTDTIESKLLDMRQTEITSSEIVAVALQTLKNYNTSAFVRYLASQTDLVSEAQLRKELKKY